MSESMLKRKRRNIGITELQQIYDMQRGRCVYCGRNLPRPPKGRGNNWTIEHLVPYAVYKWLEYSLPEEDSEKLWHYINDNANTMIACCKCNVHKGALLPDKDTVMSLKYTTAEARTRASEIIELLQPYIDEYQHLLWKVLAKKNGKCSRCLKTIRDDGILRRVNSNDNRVEENATVICNDCSFIVSRGYCKHTDRLLTRHRKKDDGRKRIRYV